MLKVEALTELEMSELADMWKRYGRVLKKLENGLIYTAIVDYVESKRDKDVIEKSIKMQNDVIEGFYNVRKEKTVDL